MKYYDNGVLNTVTDPNTSVTTYTSTACGNSFPARLKIVRRDLISRYRNQLQGPDFGK